MASPESALTEEAISSLKQGLSEDVIVARLVRMGADAGRARAILTPLVALKREAEARDPNRLRAEAAAMIERGAPPAEIVKHLVAAGIAEEFCRAEVDRLVEAHRRKQSARPCDRCGRPMDPARAYFDRLGNQVCHPCHSGNEMVAAERRVFEAEAASQGVPLHALGEDNRIRWCKVCQDHSVVLVAVTHHVTRGGGGGFLGGGHSADRVFRCTTCGRSSS